MNSTELKDNKHMKSQYLRNSTSSFLASLVLPCTHTFLKSNNYLKMSI